MTRILSELLQAPEPFFRQGLRRLEAANGHPNADIRFSSEMTHATQAKLRTLGLDPSDTTPEELYQVLQARLVADDARLIKTLRTRAATYVSADGDVVAGMIHALKGLPDNKRCFSLKASVLKTMIKKQPPKKAMKQLGYRSLDSFLKHEAPVSILAAAWLSEGLPWRQRLLEQYKRLKPSDFEDRNIAFVQPDSKRWQALAESSVAQEKHNLISFKELGALVFLPLPADAPVGATTASLALALHELNEIRAGSTFLKLCQVRPDFGKVVQSVADGEPRLSSRLLDEPVPWHLIQRYYARLTQHGLEEREQVFEPHMRLEDIVWHPVEQALSAIEPSFEFWQHSAHLGLLHHGRPVSMNVVDAALNACNELSFEHRVAHYFQRSLWHELMLRYLQREPVEQTVLAQLQPQLVPEMALA